MTKKSRDLLAFDRVDRRSGQRFIESPEDILFVEDQIGRKFDLHQASAQLRNDGQPDPSIGDLLSLPAPEINWLNCAALRMNRHSESCQ